MAAVPLVPSPLSTGAAGTFFEQNVGAGLLSLLLVRGICPVLFRCQVTEVHFQTAHLGWSTEDFLVFAEDAKSDSHRLAGQVKRSFSISHAEPECQKTFVNFWKDFRGHPTKAYLASWS